MKIYNAGQGGAFRLFIADNQVDTIVIDYETSLTEIEKLFIDEFSAKYGFRNNLRSTEHKGIENIYEWYNIDDCLLDYVKSQQDKYIKDIYNSYISLTELEKIKKASEFIRNKINFYNIIKKINPEYLLSEGYIEKLTKINCEYPFIIKSVQGNLYIWSH